MSLHDGIAVAFERIRRAGSAAGVEVAHAYVVGYLDALHDCRLIDTAQRDAQRELAAKAANDRMLALRAGRALAA